MIKDWLQYIKDWLFQYRLVVCVYNLFYPFDKTLEVVVVGEDENCCGQFQNLLQVLFTDGELKKYGLGTDKEHKKNCDVVIKIDEQNIVKVRFSSQVLPEKDWGKVRIDGDIFVPIFCLDKYQPNEYNCLWHKIDGFLGKVWEKKKFAIAALTNFDGLLQNPVTSIEQWEKSINKLYENLQNKKFLDVDHIKITENGQKILNAVFTVLQRHISEDATSNAYNICNFFCADKETNEISFGWQEFLSNLLMQLFSFDKLNNYEYQLKYILQV